MNKARLVEFGVPIVLTVAIFAGLYWYLDRRLDGLPGKPEHAWLVEGVAEGPVVVLEDLQEADETYQTRLVAVDLTTGKQLARRTRDGQGPRACLSAGPLLLCQFDRDLEFIAARTLRTEADAADAVRRLAPGARLLPWRFDLDAATGDALGLLDDGRVVRMQRNGLVRLDATVFDVASSPGSTRDGCVYVGDVSLAGRAWRVRSHGARSILSWSEGVAEGTPLPTFLHPRMLADLRTGASVGGADGVAVYHAAKLDNSSGSRLSMVGPDGALRWTADLGGECAAAWRFGDRIVVATKNPARRLVAIEIASGGVAWKVGF